MQHVLMLTQDQITSTWRHLLAAETRALYFGDLAVTYTRRKQWIAGASFFLSSGAAAAIVAQLPAWLPAALATIVAAVQAYTIAVNLDTAIATMAKLQTAWQDLATQYEQLWNHVWAEDAEDVLYRLIDRERDPSERAIAGAPYDESRLRKWQDRVFDMHQVDVPA